MTLRMQLAVAATVCVSDATLVALTRQPSAAATPPPMPRAFEVAAERARDGLFHLEGRAGRGQVDFVVDTGASVTVLSAAEARRLGGTARRGGVGSAALETAGGRTAMRWWRLPDLVVVGRRVGAVDVAVLEGSSGQALLGQDVIARLGTITIAGGRLVIAAPVDGSLRQ